MIKWLKKIEKKILALWEVLIKVWHTFERVCERWRKKYGGMGAGEGEWRRNAVTV